jgi:hypothetical protein
VASVSRWPFSDLVRARFEAEGFPDYEAELAHAGVEVDGTQEEFDASAPRAAERDALMQPARCTTRVSCGRDSATMGAFPNRSR